MFVLSLIIFFFTTRSIKCKRTEKLMQPSDYRRIENELQQQIRQATIASVPGESLNRKGWSTGYFGRVYFLQPLVHFGSVLLIIKFSI